MNRIAVSVRMWFCPQIVARHVDGRTAFRLVPARADREVRASRLAPLLATAVFFALALPTAGCAQNADSLLERGNAALNVGRYDDARRQFIAVLEQRTDARAYRGLGRTYEAEGAYAEGQAHLDRLVREGGTAPALLHARGRLLALQGRYDPAARAYVLALESDNECWECRVDLADLLRMAGREREARSILADVYLTWEQGRFRTSPDLATAGRAAAGLGRYRDANDAFRTAYQVDPRDTENLFYWGELFREKFNDAEARRTFEEALALNPRSAPVLIGLARSGFNFERQEALALQALEVNPSYVPARSLLASLHILDGQYDAASREAERALQTNPLAVDALAQLASARYLAGDHEAFDSLRAEVTRRSGAAAPFYLAVAENATRRFRYPDAALFTESAVRAAPADARARAEHGMALLRLGERDQARRHLQAAFEADPFNLFASNTLTLLDELDGFELLESAHFRLLIHPEEAHVLGPLMLALAEEAYADLVQRYPYRPADKILIEAYNDADDFAVRVAGVPHRGLLGVCFGDVIALNTPLAQGNDPYNWARTLWHEIAHTMAIGVSDYRVPRWFTEGLSVYEEARAKPEWGREMQLALVSAFERDRLLPLAEIDRGFTRPRFPGQVLLSYYHASRLIGLMAEEHGFGAIVSMLESFSEGADTRDAVAQATGASTEELDAALEERLRRERSAMAEAMAELPDVLESDEAQVTTASASAADGAFFRQLSEGARHLTNGRHREAEQAYRRALALYPEYVGPENPYLGLADVYRTTNDDDRLVEILEQYLTRAEDEVIATLELAALYDGRGDLDAAVQLRERSLYVAPYDAAVRADLADAYERTRQFERAVAHRRAVVAMRPPDLAGARYLLARSLFMSGRSDEARRAVLQALEIAPGFRDAQELLLAIVDGA